MKQDKIEARFLRIAYFILGSFFLGISLYVLRMNSDELGWLESSFIIVFFLIAGFWLYLSFFGSNKQLDKWSSADGASEVSFIAVIPAILLAYLWTYIENKRKKT